MAAAFSLATIFSSTSLAVVELDAHHRVVACNKHAMQLLGDPEGTLDGRVFFEIVECDDPARCQQLLARVAADDSPENSFECRVTVGGDSKWLLAHVVSLGGDGPALVGLTLEDLSGTRRAEVALRNSYRFVDSLVENIPDMIFVKDADELRFVRLNRAAETLTGFSREQLLGRNDYDFFPKEEADFFTAKDREVLHSRTLLDIAEEPIHTREQGLRWLHTKKIPILDENGTPLFLLGISEDVTERREAAELLLEKTRELERSNSQLEGFANALSHDLRQPLRAIVNFTDLLIEKYGDQLDDGAQKYVRYVVDGARRMDEMITGLHQFSRVGVRYAPARVDLEEVLLQVQYQLKPMIVSSRAQIEVGPLPQVIGDEEHLVLLFQNLLSNALKFRAAEGNPSVHVSAEANGDGWILRVADNGRGIPRGEEEAAFELFRRLSNAAGSSGCGIGLAIVKKIVTTLGGSVDLDSAEGGGTVVSLRLPKSRVVSKS